MRQLAHDTQGLGEGEAEELPTSPVVDPAHIDQPQVARIYTRPVKRTSTHAAFPALKAIVAALLAFAALSSACLRFKGRKKEVGLVRRRLATGGDGDGSPEGEELLDSWLCQQLIDLEDLLKEASEDVPQTDEASSQAFQVEPQRDQDFTQETTTGPHAKKPRLPIEASWEELAWSLPEASQGEVPHVIMTDPALTAEAGKASEVFPQTQDPGDYSDWESITHFDVFPGLLGSGEKDAQVARGLSPTQVAASLEGTSSFVAPGPDADKYDGEQWAYLPRASASSSSTSSDSSFYIHPTTDDTGSGGSTAGWSIIGSRHSSSSSSSSGTSGAIGSSGRSHGESFASISGSFGSPSRAYSISSLSSGPSSVSSGGAAYPEDLQSSTAGTHFNPFQASDPASIGSFPQHPYFQASPSFMLQDVQSQAGPPQQATMPLVSDFQGAQAYVGPSFYPGVPFQQQFSGLEHAAGGWQASFQQALQEQQRIADAASFAGFAAPSGPSQPPLNLPFPSTHTQVPVAEGWFAPLQQPPQQQHVPGEEARLSSGSGVSSAATASTSQQQYPQFFPQAMVLPHGRGGFMRLVRRPPRKRKRRIFEEFEDSSPGPSSAAGAHSSLPSSQAEAASSTVTPSTASTSQATGVEEPSSESKVAGADQPLADPLAPQEQPTEEEEQKEVEEIFSTSSARASAGGGDASSAASGFDYYATHLFYRLPLPDPNAQLPLFEPAARKCPGAPLGALLHPVRTLLNKERLTADEMLDLMFHTKYLLGYAERYLNQPVPVNRPFRLVLNLARRFLLMDIAWSICEINGPSMNTSAWWPAFAELVANPVPAPPHTSFVEDLSSAKRFLASRILAALEKYRMGIRPPAEDVVLIKREIFCYSNSPLALSDQFFLIWREDDPLTGSSGSSEKE
ncbi:hypothetical protein Emed_006939 [Eimeria media]